MLLTYAFCHTHVENLLKEPEIYIETKVRPLVLYKSFFKNKNRGLELVSLPDFLHDFKENCFLHYNN